MSQASSSMELVGNVYGVKDATNNYLDYVNTTVSLTAGGTPIDLSAMVVSYNDNNGGHNANLTYEGVAQGRICVYRFTWRYRSPKAGAYPTKSIT